MSEAETQRLEEAEERMNRIEATLRVTGQPDSQLLTRLERAVLQAATRGDSLADAMKGGSPESIVENLVTHFEAAAKAQGGRTHKPQPKKRLVSKRAYAAQVGSKVGLSAIGLMLCVLCIIGVIAAPLAASLLLAGSARGIFSVTVVLLIAVFGGMACLLMRDIGERALQKSTQIKPDVPLTRANMGDLTANDSLVRASSEPVQAQEGVLLRAATQGQELHEEQLLRATVRGQE